MGGSSTYPLSPNTHHRPPESAPRQSRVLVTVRERHHGPLTQSQRSRLRWSRSCASCGFGQMCTVTHPPSWCHETQFPKKCPDAPLRSACLSVPKPALTTIGPTVSVTLPLPAVPELGARRWWPSQAGVFHLAIGPSGSSRDFWWLPGFGPSDLTRFQPGLESASRLFAGKVQAWCWAGAWARSQRWDCVVWMTASRSPRLGWRSRLTGTDSAPFRSLCVSHRVRSF